ncbi:restriction endonuclease subunit S [Clostridium perfringens]
MSRNVPKLRFKGFEDEWIKYKADDLFINISDKKHNGELNVLSVTQDKGVLLREELEIDIKFDIESVKNYKRVKAGDFIISLRSFQGGFEISNQEGLISPAYTVFNFKDSEKFNSKYFSYIFKSSRFIKKLAGLIYGVRDGKAISFTDFKTMTFFCPSLQEQEKIANFLSKVDSIIEKQEKKVQYWNSYKKGMMQKIFSQKIRFQDGNKKSYTDWEEVRLSYILTETNNKNTGDLRVCSVSVRKGVIDQIEHLGRSFAAKDTSKYKLVKKGDLIYTKSPTGEFPYGIIKQSFLEENVVVSPLYGVFKPKNYYLGYILHSYFYYKENTNNYLYSIVQKGAKNTINISNEVFLSKKLNLPTSTDEQIKIFNLLLSIDNIIDKENKKLEELKQWKKGLLQQMFV